MDIAILQFFENLRTPFLTIFFAISTFFGEEGFVVLTILIMYFAVNKRIGQFLAFSVFTSFTLNGILKDTFCRPRPFASGVVSRVRLKGLVSTNLSSYSFPSGHAQTSSALFGSAAFSFKNKKFNIFAIIFVGLIAISRLYLGVHYPSDVLVGLILGVLSAFFWHIINQKHNAFANFIFVCLALIFALGLFFIKSSDSYKATGAMLGASIGAMCENKFIGFEICKNIYKKVLRVALGIVLVIALRTVLKQVFGAYLILDLVRYFILMFFMTFVYPYIFTKMRF